MSKNLYEQVGACTQDNLIAGADFPILTEGVTVVAGQGVLVRGSVLGVVTASGAYRLCDSASEDGSQVAVCILTDDTDATEEVVAEVYKTGIFTGGALVFGGADTVEDHKAELEEKNIYTR